MSAISAIPYFDHYDAETRMLRLRGAERIPDELFAFRDQIEVLDASQGSLTSLPETFSQLSQLRVAFFSQNKFSEIPPVLGECENLRILGFKSCEIRYIPPDALPRNLQWLILTDNQIAELPVTVGNLLQLRKLALAGNRLEQLPEALSACTRLELIRLGANKLSACVPDWLFQLPELAWFCDSGNPALSQFVPEVAPAIIARSELQFADRIGGSPTSTVFRGTMLSSQLPVAIKEYRGVLTSDGYVVDDMRASIAVGKHPNLVEVLGRVPGGREDADCLVLKLVPEGMKALGSPPTLATCTRDTFPEQFRITLAFLLNVLVDISAAMGHMHNKAITHGDLYAHNILSNSVGRSVLGDFGAASFINPQDRLRRLVEVRAFGYLMDDMLGRLLPEESTGAVQDRLRWLRDYCLVPDVSARPGAQEILEILKQLN